MRLLFLSASVMLYKETSDSSSICFNSYHVPFSFYITKTWCSTIKYFSFFLGTFENCFRAPLAGICPLRGMGSEDLKNPLRVSKSQNFYFAKNPSLHPNIAPLVIYVAKRFRNGGTNAIK